MKLKKIQKINFLLKFTRIYKMASLHQIPLPQFQKILHTNASVGLRSDFAVELNCKEGDNKLPEPQKVHPLILFLKEITNWFAVLLWIGALLSTCIYILEPQGNEANLFLALSLVAVILITGVITYLQTAKSQEIMEKFRDMLPSNCRVIRDGAMINMPAQKIVRGDLVEIIDGERIPADLRIVHSQNMKVDNSSITGQTALLLRVTDNSAQNILESKNVAFFGTHCKMGRGMGIVMSIGAKTYLGSVAQISQRNSGQKSPLQVEMDYFVLMITIIACSLGLTFMILGKVIVGYTILDCALFGIGIIVANVPQGILACVTISLAITAKKLAEKNVLVKNLESVETLGSTSCICSDKTGTLTMNKMAVSQIWLNGGILKPNNVHQLYKSDSAMKILLHCSILSSSARFQGDDQEDHKLHKQGTKIFGDASETALLKLVEPIQRISHIRSSIYTPAIDKQNNHVYFHFNSETKYAFGVYLPMNESSLSKKHHIFIKGAPERVWNLCSSITINGKKQSAANLEREFSHANRNFAEAGERVFGFAYKELDEKLYPPGSPFNVELDKIDLTGLTFIGLISLADPPKPTVYQAIRKCRASGVKVIMITGDQSITALSIAKQIGIVTHKTNIDLQKEGYTEAEALNEAEAVSIQGKLIEQAFKEGEDIGKIHLEQWIQKPEVIFSRTTPIHKLRIVEACQRLGHIVGVTGDGVNDAPAIKQADIGISMGISGSDVTKDAADMVLLDDDFSSIIEGIQQGRKVFDNLKKTIVYLLTSNSTQIWPFVAMVLLQIPLPLSNIFMLCICVGTDIYPAISLAYEEPQVDIMARRPRNREQRLVTIRMMTHSYGLMGAIASAAGFYTYFLIMEVYGFTPSILFNLISRDAVLPLDSSSQPDINFNRVIPFKQDAADLGNPFLPASCKGAVTSTHFPNWLKPSNSRYDLRHAYLQCCLSPNEDHFCPVFDWPTNYLPTISPITNAPVAFTTEALAYAQSGYFAAVVMVQWLNIFACKSRKYSFVYSTFNTHMMMGILVETVLMVFLLYTPSVNAVFGGRPLSVGLLGVPGLGFSMLLLLWEQGRKYLINNDLMGQQKWFQKYIYW